MNARMVLWCGAIAGIAAVPILGRGEAPPDEPRASDGVWRLRAAKPMLVGGAGENNFIVPLGREVVPIVGQADVVLNPAEGTGRIEIDVRTESEVPLETPSVQFSDAQRYDGAIRMIQELDLRASDDGRIVENVRVHGDTGEGIRHLPDTYAYFATWGRASLEVNGAEVGESLVGHAMFSEGTRNVHGQIVKGLEVYSWDAEDKDGWTDPERTEFHFWVRTTESDDENIPPYAGMLYIYFEDVTVLEKPEDATIPFRNAAGTG